VCGTIGYGFDADKNHVFPDCGACCDHFYALDSTHFFGFNGRTAVGGFDDGAPPYPDQLPLFASSDAGRSWAPLQQSINASLITSMTGPASLIPGPAPSELHTTGLLAPYTEVSGDGATSVVLRAENTTVFSLQGDKLRWDLLHKPMVYRGLNWSAACAPPGHVGKYGLRLVGGGVVRLPRGTTTLFGSGIACLGGEAQTSTQHKACAAGPHSNPPQPYGVCAASLVGFVSTDGGFEWDYLAPIFTAAAFSQTKIGPTEHDIVVLPSGGGLMAVVRADGNGLPCWKTNYYNYQRVVSTDWGLSWSAPAEVMGAGCVRPRLLSLHPPAPPLSRPRLRPPPAPPAPAGIIAGTPAALSLGTAAAQSEERRGGVTVLAGGRLCTENVSDNFLWVSHGSGSADEPWRRYSLSAVHNQLWAGNKSLRFSASVNSSDASGHTLATLSYMSLLPGAEDGSATVVYGMYTEFEGVQGANVAFSMRFRRTTPAKHDDEDDADGSRLPHLSMRTRMLTSVRNLAFTVGADGGAIISVGSSTVFHIDSSFSEPGPLWNKLAAWWRVCTVEEERAVVQARLLLPAGVALHPPDWRRRHRSSTRLSTKFSVRAATCGPRELQQAADAPALPNMASMVCGSLPQLLHSVATDITVEEAPNLRAQWKSDDAMNAASNATTVCLQDCALAAQWTAPAAGKSGTISLRQGALCMGVGEPVRPRAALAVSSCSDASEQLFTFEPQDGSLKHTRSGLRVGAEHADTNAGARCDVDKWDSTDNQRWRYNASAHVIVHKLSGRCLSTNASAAPLPPPTPPVPLSPSFVTVKLDRAIHTVDAEYVGVAYDTAAWLGIPWEGKGAVTAPDLADSYLRTVVSHLAPARLRVGGGAGDCQMYLHQPDNASFLSSYCKEKKYYDYGVRAAEFEQLAAFAKSVGLKLVFGLNAEQRQSTAVDGFHRWDPTNAAKLLDLPSACNISAYELGNELRHGKLAGTPPSPTQYGHDYQTLAALLRSKCGATSPPMAVGTAQYAMSPADVDAFLTAANGAARAFTWHHYPGGTHCSLEQFIDPVSLDGTRAIAAGIETEVRKHSVPQWCAETSGSSGGGTPSLSDRYGDGLWWLDQLGSLAQVGVTSQNRQSLLGANYGVLNYTTYEPFPSFFAVVLWKRLMGRKVLDAAASTRGVSVRAYAHCHPAMDGSVTAVLVNIAKRDVAVLFPPGLNASATVRYIMRAASTSAADVALNSGPVLSLDASGALPQMEGVQTGAGEPLTLRALSYGFVHFAHAGAPGCRAARKMSP
jgi:heparanase 1